MKLTDIEKDWCEDDPNVLEALAEHHEAVGNEADSMDYVESATFHYNRAAELNEEAAAIRKSWED